MMDMHFNNGKHFFQDDKMLLVKTVKEVHDEDWKTATVHGIGPIPAGETLKVECFHNLYGSWLKGVYNKWLYYIRPNFCDFIKECDE